MDPQKLDYCRPCAVTIQREKLLRQQKVATFKKIKDCLGADAAGELIKENKKAGPAFNALVSKLLQSKVLPTQTARKQRKRFYVFPGAKYNATRSNDLGGEKINK